MAPQITSYVGFDANAHLIEYCSAHNLHDFVLVSDQNTYTASGQQVEAALRESGSDVIRVVLEGPEVIADAHSILDVLAKIDHHCRVLLAVGSGTVTDITRFISHRTRSAFISLPTAPSVDGFNSVSAPLVIHGLKFTLPCNPPLAVFADLDVLRAAPREMVAAGFGDILGKFLSTADWQLGHLLWDERLDEAIAWRSAEQARLCAANAAAIGVRSEDGVRLLMQGLLESGHCMLEFGNSVPASGAEHHLSHFWEMMLLKEHRPALLHGAKVGVAAVITARWYKDIARLSQNEVTDRLERLAFPSRSAQVAEICEIYGPLADDVMRGQRVFLELTPAAFEAFKTRVNANWPAVQAIAAQVPEPEQLAQWLRDAGAPVSPEELGLHREEIELAKAYAHYLRNRFTINKLRLYLGIQ